MIAVRSTIGPTRGRLLYLILGHYSVRPEVDDMGRKSQSELISNAIVYTYPNGAVDILCSSDRLFIPKGYEDADDWGQNRPKPSKREKGKKSEGDDLIRSMRRARSKLRRLALANSFDYFVTLTLDKEKIDRYDGAVITKALGRWCDNMVRRHGLRYILIPELHELEEGHTERALHFHGFMAGDGLKAIDSGTIKVPEFKKPRRPRSEAERAEWLAAGGHIVYNLPQWPYGFTTAISLYGEYSAAVGYCCKYIGKQEGQRPLGRWYYSGGALEEPPKEYAILDYRDLKEQYPHDHVELEIPGSKLLVIHTKQE